MALDTYAFLEEMTERLSRIRDVRMRRLKFAETLARLHDEEACVAIEAIYIDAVLKKKPGVLLLENLAYLDDLKRIIGKERLEKWYKTSHDLGLSFAGEVLSPPPLAEDLVPLEGHKDLAKLTLGEKRALAKKPDTVLIEKLMFDPEPMVIEILLNNPRILLKHVLFIATRRPNRPEILAKVFENRKWSKVYEVRKALAANPYTPPAIVLVLVPLLTTQDLRFLEYGDNLSSTLISAVLALRDELEGRSRRIKRKLSAQELARLAAEELEKRMADLNISHEEIESAQLED